jgi:hypothetical protein
LFVDPPPPAEPGPFGLSSAPARSESIYEQTILPSAGRLSVPSTADALPTRYQQLVASPLLLAGIAAAGVVVIAAILLMIGIL